MTTEPPEDELFEFIHAAAKGDMNKMSSLLKGFPDAATWKYSWGWTALMEAARSGHQNAVEFLLDNGADIHVRSDDGFTALTEAAQNGYSGIVRLMLDKGANIDERDASGHDILWIAKAIGYTDMADMIRCEMVDQTEKKRQQEQKKRQQEREESLKVFHTGLPEDIPAMPKISFKKKPKGNAP